MDTFNVHSWGRESSNGPNSEHGVLPSGVLPPLGFVPPRSGQLGQSEQTIIGQISHAISPLKNTVRVMGHPSMRIFQDGNGWTVVTLRRNIARMDALTESDVQFIRQFGDRVLAQLKAMSRGPLTKRELRRLGHPYGFNRSNLNGRQIQSARVVPRYGNGKSLNHVQGVRGSVPTLSVINKQSGELEKAWHWDWTRDENGFEIRFWNEKPYAWMLANGSKRMQAHGPFSYAPLQFLRQFDSQIQSAIWRVRRRQVAEAMTENVMAVL